MTTNILYLGYTQHRSNKVLEHLFIHTLRPPEVHTFYCNVPICIVYMEDDDVIATRVWKVTRQQVSTRVEDTTFATHPLC